MKFLPTTPVPTVQPEETTVRRKFFRSICYFLNNKKGKSARLEVLASNATKQVSFSYSEIIGLLIVFQNDR